MLELIAMFSLGKTIGNIALEKGLKPLRFILSMIFMWIAMELLFAFVGMSLFGNVMGAYFCVLGGAAFGGYLGYRNVLNAPDTTEY
jgi:hypothetical protein